MIMGQTQPSVVDTVVAVKHTVLAIAWMAINQSVSNIGTHPRLSTTYNAFS